MKLLVSAGEKSGDEHAAKVVRALRSICPHVEVRGMGGQALRGQGAVIDVDCDVSGSVMGFAEVFKSLRTIYKAFNTLKNLLIAWKPDVVLLVDYAEFNMHFATAVKKTSIPVYHYIPPQAWGWRRSRIQRMKRDLSGMGVLFPFEKAFYEEEGIKNVSYVGHPFLEESKELPSKEAARKELDIKEHEKALILFPGSRTQEVKLIFPVMRDAAFKLKEKFPDLVVLLSATAKFTIDEKLPDWFKVVRNKQTLLLRAGDIGVIKSGTSNLQAALCGLPFVMIYKTSWLSYCIAKLIVKMPNYSIVNIIRPGTVPELLQDQATPESAVAYCIKLLENNDVRNEMQQSFNEIKEGLSKNPSDVSTLVANDLLRLCHTSLPT